jgi:substrate import-associated zinc metallohydrolase lipoprotein
MKTHRLPLGIKGLLYGLSGCLLMLASCDEVLDSSIYDDSYELPQNELDRWLQQNYVSAYNIDVKYRWQDIESDIGYNITPVEYDKAFHFVKILKHVWLEAYDEASGGVDFCRANAPRVLFLVGSPEFAVGGGLKLGTAENGMKVTFIMVNLIDSIAKYPDDLNTYYLQTMHHEFTHILNQKKNYDPAFATLSEGKYIQGDWTHVTQGEALLGGFISAYASSEPREDFAEMLSCFLTYSDAYWQYLMLYAGSDAAAIITEKLSYVRSYMKNVWNIDLEELQAIVRRRTSEIGLLKMEF